MKEIKNIKKNQKDTFTFKDRILHNLWNNSRADIFGMNVEAKNQKSDPSGF